MTDVLITNRHSAAWLRAMREIEAEGSPSPAAHCPPPAGIEAAAAMWRSGGAAPPIADGGARSGVRACPRSRLPPRSLVRAPTPVWSAYMAGWCKGRRDNWLDRARRAPVWWRSLYLQLARVWHRRYLSYLRATR